MGVEPHSASHPGLSPTCLPFTVSGSMALETGRLAPRLRLRDLGLSLSLSKTHVFSVQWDCGWTLS